MQHFVILAAVIILAGACTTIQKNSTSSTKSATFDKQGHRGSRGLMPENTIPAMLNAIELGVTTLETDACITKDGQVVLSHEPYFNHEITTKPDGQPVIASESKSLNLYQMDYAEIKKYDVGLRGNPKFPQQTKMAAVKPLLADMIDAAEKYCADHHKAPIHYNIETKTQAKTDNQFHPAPAEFVETLLAVIRSKNIEDRVTIQSFDIRTLQYLHQKHPTVKTSLLVEANNKKTLDELLTNLGFTPTTISPYYELVNEEFITACRKKKLIILPWTVNDAPTIKKLRQMGVDGIISDYPNLFE